MATVLCLLIGYPMALGIDPRQQILAQYPADAGDPAVLDLVPAARLRVDGAAGEQQLVQSRPDRPLQLAGAERMGDAVDPDDELEFRRRAGDGLFLPAVHDPAALRQPRKAGPDAGRGRDGPRLAPVTRLPRHHAAPFDPGHDRGRAAGLHPGGGRTDHPLAGRQCLAADDRARDLGRILQRARLADGLGRGGGAAVPAGACR